MARCKNHAPAQIVNILRQIEAAIANGKTTPLACKDAGITEQTDRPLRNFRQRSEAPAVSRSPHELTNTGPSRNRSSAHSGSVAAT